MDITSMKDGHTAQAGPREIGLVANTEAIMGFDFYEDLGV